MSQTKAPTIAISSNTSWYLYNFRRNTILALIKNNYRVIAIAPHDSYAEKIKSLGAEFIHIEIDQGGMNPLKELKTLIHFNKILSHHHIDVLLNFTPKNNIYGTLASKIRKIKTINNIAGLGMVFINKGIAATIAKMLYRISQRYAYKIFFQNKEDRALFLTNGIAQENQTDLLPGSGVDILRFTVTEAPDDGVVRFLLVARMLYDKGITQYVDAARYMRNKYGDNIEFRLLGFLDVNNPSAVSDRQMQTWVNEGIVNYLGVSDKVEEEMAIADCIVLPSFYREGVPRSLLEAGAMGKPIITTDNVGCRETVNHGVNGYLCEPKSTESLITQLEAMFSLSHQERLSMGWQSRQKMTREFNEQFVIDKYLNAIEDALR